MREILVVVLCLVCMVSAQSRRFTSRMGSRYQHPSYWRNPHVFQQSRRDHRRNRRMGTMLSGANVCRQQGQEYCCPGWKSAAGSNKCVIPVCKINCGDGICVKPNQCLCQNGVVAPSCGAPRFRNGKCMMRCMNGGTCQHNQCQCADGFTGAHCGQPICGPGCLNGGRCISRNKCLCLYGFTGDRCQTDYRVGPCFLHRANDTCMDEVPGVACHKKLCCATIGQGWGIPCEECAARNGNCTRGRLPPNCDDINECKLIPGLCRNGECVNTDGSFRCDCPEGYKYSRYLHTCEDINECELGYCEGGECENTEGSFICHCPVNYLLSSDRTYCILDAPGHCYTTIESGMCASPLPHLTRRTQCCCTTTGEVELETLGKCFAIPDHAPERCPTLGTPEYVHQCPAGQIDTGPINGTFCASQGNRVCRNGFCEGTATGDYQCRCNEGYRNTDDLKHCVDINECGDGNGDRNICGMHGTCMNTEGSFKCMCDSGFETGLEVNTCIDIDECRGDEGICENGACINTKGSYRCRCNEGYRPSATQLQCEDINECIERGDLCENGRCVNIIGRYQCVCNPGFAPSDDKTSCVDENECELHGMCTHGTCSNEAGGFECICDNGYELTADAKHCQDVNECVNNPCTNGECVNTQGAFECRCHRFQQLDATGRTCILESRVADCYRNVFNGQCTVANALGMQVTRGQCCCTVPGGTSAWGECEPCPEIGSANHVVLCSRIIINNPCELHGNPCTNGACINMENNDFRCECKPGFVTSDDRKSCIDIDECSDPLTSTCSNGLCRNTPGSFVCTCEDGFVLRGDVCEDVNECESSPCIDGDCRNTPGSFECICDENSALDIHGLRCYNVQLQQCWKTFNNGTCADSFRSLTAEACCNSIGQAWGDRTCTSCAKIELRCPKGYEYDVTKDICKDIPECTYDVCDKKSECIETEGSFRCVCPSHLTLDNTGLLCIDMRMGQCYYEYMEEGNQCLKPSTAPVMRKVDCCCTVGQGWGDDCEVCPAKETEAREELCRDVDDIIGPHENTINECILYPDLCENGQCQNTAESFICDCFNGYTLDTTGRACEDINECDISSALCGEEKGTCVNTNGSFVCNCNEGYQTNAGGNDCLDINECLQGGRCTGGSCVNTEGSYECTCPPGRSLSEDKTRCVDIDECAVTNNLCKPNGQCVNMLGRYMCVCDVGYETTDDKMDCVDVDECQTNNGECSDFCLNQQGSYECRCNEGYTLSYDGRNCADVDECLVQPNRCDGGRCDNTEGGFDCVCFDGFMLTPEMDYCSDIDECAMNPNICLAGKCHNTRGSYTCNCDRGYCVPQEQMICVDEDECRLGKHTCDVNADCSNTDGSFTCECIDGFEGDGTDCEDINECQTGTHGCDINAECENTLGSYACHCNDGFYGDGYTCSDRDDCVADENLCGEHGQCLNIQGSFECECSMGFMTTSDKKACKDIDECAIEHICENGRCHNIPGLFRCDCLTGFEKNEDGTNCTDIDECADVANCINGECINTIGSYACGCPEGFDQNPTGVGCVDTRTGDCFLMVEGDDVAPVCTYPIGVNVARASCCCNPFPKGWGNPCELCPDRNTSEYMTLCPGGDGFRPNPITVFLEDIDECMELPGLCQGGKCENVFGSFVCVCKEGYTLNEESRVCEDIDECSEVENVCGPGTCSNTVGAFNCLCPDGYRPINRGRECEDQRVANCYRSFNSTSLQCVDSLAFNLTKASCCCTGTIGQGWNNPCEVCPNPTDEPDEFYEVCKSTEYQAPAALKMCDKFNGLCEGGQCINEETGTGYRCECPRGHRFSEKLLICEDIDECYNAQNLCHTNAACINTKGSYMCRCTEGFRGDGVEQCEDIDECLDPLTCVNGQCENAEGGFTCDCDRGFRPINGDESCEDINECETKPCGPGTCQNMIGSFQCTCYNGYDLSDNGDCIDVDECASSGTICRNGECSNTPGTFECNCSEGYKVSVDGRSCLDINECAEDQSVCGVGTCMNKDGSYKCFCPIGYTSGENGTTCTDEDECNLLTMCKNGECVNTPGSFSCICPPNHILTTNKKYCIDQTKGQCYRNYVANTCSEPMPQQVTRSSCCCRCSEAAWGDHGTCLECPKPGSPEFADICPLGCGTTPDGIDINECAVNNPCKNGKCKNMAGGFKCICREGFKLKNSSGWICVDENECTERTNPCGPGTCVNSEGGFQCSCEPGYYIGPRMNCIDIDECAQETHGCKFRCKNTDGSYVCLCPDGYALNVDGRRCDDIDECSDPSLNTCDEKDMICKNQIGFYECNCRPGFLRIGVADLCENINECDSPGVCAGGECIDEVGSYSCRCFQGYEYDKTRRVCLDQRRGLCYMAVHQRMCESTAASEHYVTKTSCCCGDGVGFAMNETNCELCPAKSSTAYTKLCPHGQGFDENGQDIDDCLVRPGLCRDGTCQNILGSYKCICNHGYQPTLSKLACIDIDECSMPNGCAGGSRCVNTIGGYKCVCPPGYQITNTMRCVDVDECVTKEHVCQFICQNTIGSYQCGCPSGFTMHMNASCVDKNECKLDPDICGKNAACVNDVGGYHCVCAPGYEKTPKGDGCVGLPCESQQGVCGNMMCMNMGDGIRCVPGCNPGWRRRFNPLVRCESLDCRTTPCKMGKVCEQNGQGEYRCTCSRGFSMRGWGGGCNDINECQFQRNPCKFGCRNSFGGYGCGCPQNYFGYGGGQCFQGRGGFQQQIQQRQPYMPYGQTVGRCYNCGNRRYRRSIGTVMEEVRSDDTNPPPVNVSVPIIMHLSLHDLRHREHLIQLIPSLRQLSEHTRYHITHGNEGNIFRIHKSKMEEGTVHYLHLNQPTATLSPGKYKLGIEVRPMLDLATAEKESLNSKEIEDAMIKPSRLEVEFNFEN